MNDRKGKDVEIMGGTVNKTALEPEDFVRDDTNNDKKKNGERMRCRRRRSGWDWIEVK
ncbi:hypothetical protein TWF506_002795 [Arthrobotrys conoides]|uniref:Uncharacterized protein n=1 Tax=Arthrobotrys conoides TaxID=74498 RepID=A0AAN8NH93_9PEZI